MDYVDKCYRNETFLKAYETPMRPMPSPKSWKKTSAIPPKPPAPNKLPDRPKKYRRKELEEVRAPTTRTSKLRMTYVSMTCRACGSKDQHRVCYPNKTPNTSMCSTLTSKPIPPTQRHTEAVSVIDWFNI